MDIALILSKRYIGAQWSLDGSDYLGLSWYSEDMAKPTKKTLEKLWPEVQLEAQTELVDANRRAAYQTDSDPIFFEYQRGDKTQQEWLDAVQAVKDAHPYPPTV